MAKYNTSTEILDFDGNTIPAIIDGKPHETEKLTFKTIMFNALTAQLDVDRELTGEDKYRIYQITKRVAGSKYCELTLEERKLILDRASFISTPLVIGRMNEFFDDPIKQSKDKSD